MKTWMLLLVPLLMLLALGPAAQAAAPAKAPAAPAFAIEGKVLRLAKSRFEIQVTSVEKAAGLKAGMKIWVQETAKTKILQAGKAVAATLLKVGERVEVNGKIMKTRRTSAYDAITVQIVTSR